MSVKVGEFFIDLAVDAASGNLSVNQLVAGLGKLDVVSVGAVGTLGKITSVLWGMAKAATGTAVEMSVLGDIVGTDPKVVQQWEKAAQRMNISSGSVTKSIKAVHEMMGGIAARKAPPPMELTGWLGITPQKGVDAQGRPQMKNFFDLMGEISDPKSKYWSFTPQVQQQVLGGAFPGASQEDLFRILNEMRAGKFRPEDITVLKDKQVEDLSKVKKQEIEIVQKLEGMFGRLLTSGGTFADVLESISDKLDSIDKFMGSEVFEKALSGGAEVSKSILSSGGFLPMAQFDLMKKGFSKFDFDFATAPSPGRFTPGPDAINGKVEVNLKGPGPGDSVSKTFFLKNGVTNTDVENVTINLGNGGNGQ